MSWDVRARTASSCRWTPHIALSSRYARMYVYDPRRQSAQRQAGSVAMSSTLTRFTLAQAPLETRLPSGSSMRPRTSPAVTSFVDPRGALQQQTRAGTAQRAFRPARSAASSSRVHGAWVPSKRASAWSTTGVTDTLVVQPSNGPAEHGPRISEPVRLDPPAQWGAPVHHAPGRPRPRPSPAGSLTGARGTNKLQDFNILALACHRAGKLKEEAVAQYCRCASAP